MARPVTNTETTLHLQRTFAAPRERVFRAWTDPEELKRWWCPEGWTSAGVEIDLRTGGEYRIGMKKLAGGDLLYITGKYLEVRPPQKLVYTWNWQGAFPGMPETRVTVEFVDVGGATEVFLTHENFPNAEIMAEHNKGWTGVLDRLANTLSSSLSS